LEAGQPDGDEAGEPAEAQEPDLEGPADAVTPLLPDTEVEEPHSDVPGESAMPATPDAEDAGTPASAGTEALEAQEPDQVQDLSETVESHPEANGVQDAIAVDDPEPAAVES
jgi:hypothetical protein